MGLLDSVFKRSRRSQEADAFFRLITGYNPLWATTPKKIYEMEIIRATIHSFASHCSKLKPEVWSNALRGQSLFSMQSRHPFLLA